MVSHRLHHGMSNTSAAATLPGHRTKKAPWKGAPPVVGLQPVDSLDPVLNSLPTAYWKLTGRGVVLAANLASEELTGFAPHEFVGRSLGDFLVETIDLDFLVNRLKTAGSLCNLEACIRRKDEATRNILLDASLLENCDGTHTIHCLVRDDSVLKKTDVHLREQAGYFTKTAEAVIMLDPSGLVRHWSKGAEELYQLSPAGILGKPFPAGLSRNPAADTFALKTTLKDGEWRGRLAHTTSSGSPVEIESRWVRLPESASTPESILLIAENAAGLRELEEERLRGQRQECLGTLAGGIAHDLNNILQPISIAIDLFRARTADTESQEMLDVVDENLRRATDLVRQILTFTSGTRTERHSIEVAPLFKEVTNFIRQAFPKTIQLQVVLDEALDTFLADHTQVEQILINLCVNARDAMPEGGRLRLEASNFFVDGGFANRHPGSKPGPYVRLTVGDTGTGIPRRIRDKIFEPFFTTKGPEQGTGLGLATTLGIVRSHGGFLTLETEEGCGTSFHVFLPATRSGTAHPGPGAPSQRTGELSGEGESILLVDDEATVLKVMQRSLEKSGYRVLTAEDGEQGLEVFSRHRHEIRLVITDMSMPGIDGPGMIAALRKFDKNVKIICTSGLNTPSNTEALAPLGVETVLSKPCNSKTILQAIKKALGETPATPTA